MATIELSVEDEPNCSIRISDRFVLFLAILGRKNKLFRRFELTNKSIVMEKLFFEYIGKNVNMVDSDGDTPLILACSENKPNIIKKIINMGANLNVQNKEGNTALLVAANYNYFDIVEILISAGADVNIQNKQGVTPLIYILHKRKDTFYMSVKQKNVIAQLFIDYGADLDIQNCHGETALMVASGNGNTDAVQMLIAANVNLDIQNKIEKMSALYLAISNLNAEYGSNVEIIKLLLDAGADFKLEAKNGWTAIKLTKDIKSKYVFELLAEKDPDLRFSRYFS